MSYEKILGCLLGAAAGDAMGAATETRNMDQIRDYFHGYVESFLTPPDDTFAHGCELGQVTDDFSLAYMNCCEIVANGGKVSEEVAKKALVKWFSIPQFGRFAGPTTKAAVYAMMGKTVETHAAPDFVPAVENNKGTNGAAMKAAPLALFSGGDVDRAIADTITMCKVSHNNNVSLSGACAVSAAAAAALHDSCRLEDLIEAGVYGAIQGDKVGRQECNVICGPSIAKRIRKAAELGLMAEDMESALRTIGAYMGSGLMAAEAVPAVFGIIAASGGSAVKGIWGGVNIGDDTDTVATMVGGILGAYEGVDAFPADYLQTIREHNEIDIENLAKEIWALEKR